MARDICYYCSVCEGHKTPRRLPLDDLSYIAFHHPQPQWPIHAVIVPRKHTTFATLVDSGFASAFTMVELFQFSRKVIEHIHKIHPGFRAQVVGGLEVGQTQGPHMAVHIAAHEKGIFRTPE
jgi:diadenosine tetraphosphate (Ap4A) HIT family hydrolase